VKRVSIGMSTSKACASLNKSQGAPKKKKKRKKKEDVARLKNYFFQEKRRKTPLSHFTQDLNLNTSHEGGVIGKICID